MEHRLVLALVLFALVPCLYVDTAAAQRTGSLASYKISSFQNPDSNAKLNHVLLHSPSGNVYVGAVNSIYRLDNNLDHQMNVSTFKACDGERVCANNNKVLFVEPLTKYLITCGSYTGTCQLRHGEELSLFAEIENVVASDKDKTTVGILAPGPGNKDWLYVAATYRTYFNTNNVPPVSRITLDYLSPNIWLAIRDYQVNFAGDYKSNPFDISYVYGFSSNSYVYYVTAQQMGTDPNAGFVSKVVRVCHQADVPDLDAYTEITIQCGQGSLLAQAAHVGPAGPGIAASLGIDSSDLMLYAVFTKDDNSALCMFNMSDIEGAFVTAVGNCIRNRGDSVRYLDGSKCGTTPVPDATIYLCEADSLYKYANNPNAVVSTPLLELAGTMSSITTNIETHHTIAFIGTSSGLLLKVHIENGTSARHYESIMLGDAPVLRDISLDDTKRHIYVLTEQQLLKLRVESNCSQYTSCETFIGHSDGDPHCGWCTLENKCTRHEECSMANEYNRWLPYNEIRCVDVSKIVPYSSLPFTELHRTIGLTVEHLPKLQDGETYSCKFNDLPVNLATTIGNTVSCTIPEISARPNIPSNEDHVTMQLGVFSSESMVTFVSTEFSFYDCSRHKKCGECVNSAWDCDWCVFDNIKCTHQSTECTTGDTIITGLNVS